MMCASQIFVRTDIIDLTAPAVQGQLMPKTAENSCCWVFRRLNFFARLTAENIALRHRLIVVKRNRNRHPPDSSSCHARADFITAMNGVKPHQHYTIYKLRGTIFSTPLVSQSESVYSKM